ncbi:MAG: 3-hydroxyacyl-CoA dehydrogenase family protein [Microcella sp.]|uniref:3-hydroxyacyl-CoA dehydrogenase family protein n=1 Tax=Microcella sp. TaxID=1913979 RepID=UPI0024CCE498|nr:3-hydroxyacyl-CoA dehydrogenase family protein [Microcella sp.]UYN83447.1 MAG: 3-hydroxyacyl-CoA dehydrogenase family protein [Microcella sp.]
MTISTIAVVGSGYMGGGIAQVLALAGCSVVLSDQSAEIASANRERIIAEAGAFAEQKLFVADAAETIARNVRAAASVEEAVEGVEFVEEAVPEIPAVKAEMLGRISAANPTAIIGSNTSTISIGELATHVQNPERFLGVHFSNPAPFIPGVELIPHDSTRSSAVDAVATLLRSAGKSPATVTDATGFVVNRLQYALFHEATQLMEEGVATADDIDLIVRTTFGMRLPFFGPFAIADMAGLDVYEFCYRSLQTRFTERFATPDALRELVEQGKLGTKTGAGFRDIDPARIAELIAYRNEAYVRVQQLIDELGPHPFDERT